MYGRITAFSLAIATLSSGVAQADILAGGPVYGGPGSNGGQVTCRYFNAGPYPVTFTLRQLITNTNVIVAPAADSCNVAVAAGRYCAVTGVIAGNLAYSCRAYVTGTEVNVTGAAEVLAPNGTITVLPILKQ